MRIVVIEDEKPAARLLVRAIESLGYEVEKVLYSVSEAVDWFHNQPSPDLIFADIQLADGLSFDVFEITAVQSAVVFVTAYDQYALKAFKLNSVDYLLKPVDVKELRETFRKIASRSLVQPIHKELLEKLYVKEAYIKRFVIRIGSQIKLIGLDQVTCVYRENRGVYVRVLDERDYLLDETSLEGVEGLLDPQRFYRVNRKQIIALEYIKQIMQLSNARLKVVMRSFSEEVVVSRERVADFKTWLSKN